MHRFDDRNSIKGDSMSGIEPGGGLFGLFGRPHPESNGKPKDDGWKKPYSLLPPDSVETPKSGKNRSGNLLGFLERQAAELDD
jgi:hypothetical protein